LALRWSPEVCHTGLISFSAIEELASTLRSAEPAAVPL